MADKTLDLQDCLANAIISNTGIAVKIDYMAPDNKAGLVPEQGSHRISRFFDGVEEWQYNYAITIEDTSQSNIKEKLFTISQYLGKITDLQSANDTFEFEELQVSSAPAMVFKDTSGNVQYLLDVAVLVLIKNQEGFR